MDKVKTDAKNKETAFIVKLLFPYVLSPML